MTEAERIKYIANLDAMIKRARARIRRDRNRIRLYDIEKAKLKKESRGAM